LDTSARDRAAAKPTLYDFSENFFATCKVAHRLALGRSCINPPARQRGHEWPGSQHGGRSWTLAVLSLRRGLREVIAFSYGAAAAAFGRAQKNLSSSRDSTPRPGGKKFLQPVK